MPTGTSHAIWGVGWIEDPQEPMHTNFGVPGLCGYPTILYYVPVLISTGIWGAPHSHFCWFGPQRGWWGCLGTWSTDLPEQMDTISSGRHCGSVATACCCLVACPFILDFKKKWGDVGGVIFHLFCHILALGGVDSIQPQAQQHLSHTNNTGPKASTVCTTFLLLGCWGLGWGFWGASGSCRWGGRSPVVRN